MPARKIKFVVPLHHSLSTHLHTPTRIRVRDICGRQEARIGTRTRTGPVGLGPARACGQVRWCTAGAGAGAGAET